jgi:hypothetical protein
MVALIFAICALSGLFCFVLCVAAYTLQQPALVRVSVNDGADSLNDEQAQQEHSSNYDQDRDFVHFFLLFF